MSKKEDLEKKKKMEILKKKSQEALDAKRARDLETKKTSQLVDEAEASWKKSFGKGFTPSQKEDARMEIEVGKKYKDVSPIVAKGGFNTYTPKDIAKTPTLTQADTDRKNISEMYRKRRNEIKR